MLGEFWTQISLIDGLAVTDLLHGHLVLLTLSLWIFYGGYVKDRIYQNHVHDLATLCTRIVEAVKTIDVDMLQRVWKKIKYRLDLVRATRGVHLECFS